MHATVASQMSFSNRKRYWNSRDELVFWGAFLSIGFWDEKNVDVQKIKNKNENENGTKILQTNLNVNRWNAIFQVQVSYTIALFFFLQNQVQISKFGLNNCRIFVKVGWMKRDHGRVQRETQNFWQKISAKNTKTASIAKDF